MKTRVFIITIIIGIIATTNVLAINLIEVYKQALSSDPTFKSANAQWLANRETLAISYSALLPQLSASAVLKRTLGSEMETTTSISDNYYNNNTTYALQLKQSLFNFGNWASVWQAQAIVKKAEVTFMAAAAELLLRTATAYFNVLQSKDVFHYAKANREWLERTLNQNIHRYEVGLIPITDLENTRAKYDQAIADEIASNNDLSDKFEKLGEITGIRYIFLNPVKETFPLLSPKPADIEKWAKAAEQQNFDLAATRYETIRARENVKIQNAGHLPTLDASGNYLHSYNSNYQGTGTERDKGLSASLALNIPLFQGGFVLASAKQANYQYQKAIADQEKQHRLVVSNTRQAYLGVISYISQIKANQQAIRSAESSLRATRAGYEAGTRTMVDVLEAQSQLYDNQKKFTTSEYGYITSMLTLKKLVGILAIDDIAQINSWLEKQKLEINNTSTKIQENVQNKKNTNAISKSKAPKTTVHNEAPTMKQSITMTKTPAKKVTKLKTTPVIDTQSKKS